MKNTNSSFTSNRNHQPHRAPQVTPEPQLGKCEPKAVAPTGIRTTARDYANPVDYDHPYPSMAQLADLLALRYDANRTRHSYYRQLRLIHQHFSCDPSTVTEAQLREYFLFVKLKKHWKPKSIRQALASAKVFFVELLGKPDWTIFSQIRAKDHDTLPAVLTRPQVQTLLAHIRLRRYRTPLKLIYCCGLRLSECLGLTIHDIRGKENKLLVRHGKGDKDRVVPLPTPMYEELRRYWAFHRHLSNALQLLAAPGHRRSQTTQYACGFSAFPAAQLRHAPAGGGGAFAYDPKVARSCANRQHHGLLAFDSPDQPGRVATGR
jgi:integrase